MMPATYRYLRTRDDNQFIDVQGKGGEKGEQRKRLLEEEGRA